MKPEWIIYPLRPVTSLNILHAQLALHEFPGEYVAIFHYGHRIVGIGPSCQPCTDAMLAASNALGVSTATSMPAGCV